MFRRRNRNGIVRFADFGTHFAEFCRHGRNTVRFLDTPASNATNSHRSVGKQGKNRNRHSSIRNIDGVEFTETFELATRAGAFCPVGAHGNVCAHFLEHFDKGDIALTAIATHAKHAHLAACNGSGSQRITCRAGIALDHVVTRSLVHALGHIKFLEVGMLDFDTELFHDIERQENVRGRNQFAFHVNMERRFCIRSTNQKCRKILARNVTADRDRTTLQAVSVNAHRRESIGFHVVNVSAKRSKSIDQVANRAFLHAFFAAQVEHATTESKGCAQGAHGRARIAQVKACNIIVVFDQNRRRIYRACRTFNYRFGKIVGHVGLNTQCLQSFAHIAGIVAFQQVVQTGGSFGKGRNQKHTVGNTFGTRHTKFTIIRLQSRNLNMTGANKGCIHGHKFIN